MIKKHITYKCDRCGAEQIEPFKYKYLRNSLGLKASILDFKFWFKSQFATFEFSGFDGQESRSYDMCKPCARIYLTEALESLEEGV